MIADTTVISNFAYANRLDILKGIGNICTTVEVMDELQAANRNGVLKIGFSEPFIEILRMDESFIAFNDINGFLLTG